MQHTCMSASFKGRRSRTRGRSQCVLVKIWCICSTLFRNLRFLGIPRKRTMGHAAQGNPTQCGSEQCRTPDTRRILRGRYSSVSDSVRRVSAARGSAVSDTCRVSDTVRIRTVSGCPNGPRWKWQRRPGLGLRLGLGLGLYRIQRVCVRTFYRMARFLGIPRKRSAFCRKRRFLKRAEQIYYLEHVFGLASERRC